MSKMMMKMLADMAGVKPDDIANNVAAFQKLAGDGIATLEQINMRLGAIENHLGINRAELPAPEMKGKSDGQENGIAE